MAVLDTQSRNALADSEFALPGRKYPIHDENHARDALARVAANGTPSEQAMVRIKVKKRYPMIKVDSGMPRK